MGEEPFAVYNGAVPLDDAVNQIACNAGCFGLGVIVQAYVVSWDIGGKTQDGLKKDTQDYKVGEGSVLRPATSPSMRYLYELLPYLLQDKYAQYRWQVSIRLGLRKKPETDSQPEPLGFEVESEEIWSSDEHGNVRTRPSKPKKTSKGRGMIPRRR